jgi:hypothetical protein
VPDQQLQIPVQSSARGPQQEREKLLAAAKVNAGSPPKSTQDRSAQLAAARNRLDTPEKDQGQRLMEPCCLEELEQEVVTLKEKLQDPEDFVAEDFRDYLNGDTLLGYANAKIERDRRTHNSGIWRSAKRREVGHSTLF